MVEVVVYCVFFVLLRGLFLALENTIEPTVDRFDGELPLFVPAEPDAPTQPATAIPICEPTVRLAGARR